MSALGAAAQQQLLALAIETLTTGRFVPLSCAAMPAAARGPPWLARLLLLLLLLGAGPGAAARLNVVMVAVDDLRTELSIYPEGKHMHTPNFERLVNEPPPAPGP